MGMAASQARFLGLTARKSNTEYEGQQINQQRTTLANQSANYYNQLLGMTVPVPPSVADFTKTVYTFEDGSLSNSITSLVAQRDGTYLISYTQSWNNPSAMVTSGSPIYSRTKNEDGSYSYFVGAKELRQLGTINEDDFSYRVIYVDDEDNDQKVDTKKDDIGYYTLDDEGNKTYYTPKDDTTPEKFYDGKDEYLRNLSLGQIESLKKEEDLHKDELNKKYGTADWQVRYVYNTTSKAWSPYYVKKDSLDNAVYNSDGFSQSGINTYTIGSALELKEEKGITARLEQDASGRIISVTLKPGAEDEVTYAVKTNTSTDQAAYEDAMNQYEYDKYEYEQSIQNINAKIEIIQSEDKNLELRLKQLDTEQNAIQTEIDAVSKVIEKNTESTFKTFG